MNVQTIENKGDKAAILVMEDGARVWTPDREKAIPLVGKPIPADWMQKQGEYGPQAFPPKPPGEGGKAAYRNTKEGFLAEQEGWNRKQEIDQRGLNRRTALMQAVEMTNGPAGPVIENMLQLADQFYAWLEEPFGGTSSSEAGERHAAPTSAGARGSVAPTSTEALAESESPKSQDGGGARKPLVTGSDGDGSAGHVVAGPDATPPPPPESDEMDMRAILEDMLRRLGLTAEEKYRISVEAMPIQVVVKRINELRSGT